VARLLHCPRQDCDLMVAVIDHDGQHALEFPCHGRDGCWIASSSRRSPTMAGNGERSALRGSLWWHVRGETINPQMSSAADAIPLISLPLSGVQRTGPDPLMVRTRRE
jgi:hypothetical protein